MPLYFEYYEYRTMADGLHGPGLQARHAVKAADALPKPIKVDTLTLKQGLCLYHGGSLSLKGEAAWPRRLGLDELDPAEEERFFA